MRRLILVAACAGALAPAATASQLVDRNASRVSLAVNGSGEALLTYQTGGRLKHVLAWGGINAIAPSRMRKQRHFWLDYAGGYGKYGRAYWRGFRNRCGPYSGPPVAHLVVACTAPDGTHWALQAWQRALPNHGRLPSSWQQASWELRLSHWTALAVLTVKTDWSRRRYDHLYGSLRYRGRPVYGFRTTSDGRPLDRFGRLIYVDTFNSRHGPGWRRDNSFVTHRPRGIFCYAFLPRNGYPRGKGTRYRVTAVGPGVTPDLMWQGSAPGPYDAERDRRANAEQRARYSDRLCQPT
ncbi:MAG: hypothetical protein M3R70_05960 [Actinomycetota bacterium]|nr:hypothetical protein [Actinomycetota bacterium]